MFYGIVPADENGTVASTNYLVTHKTLDYCIDKFLKEAVERMKKEKLTIPQAMQKNQMIIEDSTGEYHGMIVGAANEKHPRGIFIVFLPKRGSMRLYNFDLRMVGRNTLA